MVVPVNSGRRCGKRPLSHLVYALVSRMIGFVGTESERAERKTTSLFSSLNKGGRQPTGLGSGEGSLPIRVPFISVVVRWRRRKIQSSVEGCLHSFLVKNLYSDQTSFPSLGRAQKFTKERSLIVCSTLSFMPCQLPPAPVENVTDDTISLLCTLAMEKCSKKSEKKKASCGGAAMRKRLLIKNFVAQMLAFERQSSPTDMDEDSSYDNDYENNESDEYHMDSEESGMEMENLKNMDNPPMASMLSTSPEDDIALSMVRRQNDDLYLVPGTSHELYDEFSDKPLSERTNNSYSSWEDYHTVPGREYSSCPTLESEESVRNSLFSDNLFVHFSSYPQGGCSTLPDTSSLDYSLQAHPRPENFFDGMSINDDGMNCESSCDQGDADCPAEFASLVNLNEPMRFLCRTEAQRELYCRRSITDLDTNTVVEEEDYGLNRSQRKRQVFAQDDLSNYMFLTTSPKRIRL